MGDPQFESTFRAYCDYLSEENPCVCQIEQLHRGVESKNHSEICLDYSVLVNHIKALEQALKIFQML